MSFLQALFQWGQGLPPLGLYLFIFAWLFIESTGFPISDEPLLLLSGYLAASHRLIMAVVIVIALVGKVAASCLAYWIGHYIRLEGLARPETQPETGAGRWLYYLRPTLPSVIAIEERFRRQGVWSVFLGRLVPVVRSFISYPAGAARMPFGRFLAATTAGSLTWITIWTVLGAVLGHSYKMAFQRWGSLSWIVLALFVAALVIVYIWNHRRSEREALALYAERLKEAEREARRKAAEARKRRHAATATSGAVSGPRPAATLPRTAVARTSAQKKRKR
jgi:membrane protein DedA with SNARE-associated domain